MKTERPGVGRRAILEGGIAAGLQLCFGPRVFGQADATSMFPKAGDVLVKAGDASSRPLTPGDIKPNEPPTMAWAMEPGDKTVRNGSRLNAILLVRLEPSRLAEPSRANAADGIVAYTTICTHSGCEVSDWLADDQILSCPCHDSLFDPKDNGKVIDGPAPRMLPALPLKVADDTLTVAAPFTSRVGFDVK